MVEPAEIHKVNVPFSSSELESLKATALAAGYESVEEYIRGLVVTALPESYQVPPATQPLYQPVYTTRSGLGRVYQGDSAEVLRQLDDDSVDLIMTSPPFGLVRKKDYGNEDAEEYVRWFKPFAREFKRVLKPTGSLVIDIGGAWKKGLPVKSVYQYELLISLVKEFGFFLAQEFFWWNPARLPTPAEWVTVRRIRVKDAVNTIWWLSKTPYPKASNRRVLQPYSESMLNLLKNGYKPKRRPSGHDISDKFGRDNGGAIPPNLIALANTESNSAYHRYCKERGIPEHPAKYPVLLPAFFIQMLTDVGDLVVDPFAGSLTTGEAAELLERKWVCIEKNSEYIRGGLGRFEYADPEEQRRPFSTQRNPYKIFPPKLIPSQLLDRLPEDGGRNGQRKKV
jgi:site-specific DNA-methyltransferase (cytosine-N4-specific)